MLKPLQDRVIVEKMPLEQQMPSGIVLPDTAKEKPTKGKVVAVGDGRLENGVKVAPEVQVGDTIIYNKYAGMEVKLEDKEYLILKESDILAIAQ
ncbi:co-chaperone GroES [Paenibacillus alkalitolerans]|uniref:co-chaperone GroES n=1 Tax=Paenibacillus alkalitolerans TaxID=2799335 RepID=UPI0018F62517|nr:co-chaperone GroES [Paenibacillus alkalitolerans]